MGTFNASDISEKRAAVRAQNTLHSLVEKKVTERAEGDLLHYIPVYINVYIII